MIRFMLFNEIQARVWAWYSTQKPFRSRLFLYNYSSFLIDPIQILADARVDIRVI